MMKNYPIKFKSTQKEKSWSDNVVNKETSLSSIRENSKTTDIDKQSTSVVINGSLKGMNLKQLIATYTTDFLGKKNYQVFGENFPLLTKFIDTDNALSTQPHTADEASTEQYTYPIEDISEDNKTYDTDPRVLIAEIQQTADITYRIFDWNTVENMNTTRELHTELAIDVISFSNANDYHMHYHKTSNQSSTIASCKYFTTNIISIKNYMLKDYAALDSFIIFMCIKGTTEIAVDGHLEIIKKGETIVIPAAANEVIFYSKDAELLEIYV